MLPIGSNGIENGVTIDLRLMRKTTLSADNTTASVEPGSKWGEVYKYLDAEGYAIPGGRASDVGVAGLTLGGGNSFFAARYGFVCDNVRNFEIVLGNGSIVNANATSNPDLFKALKGGTGNFVIVTRFDFIAFPSGPLWGGTATYDNSHFEDALEPFVEFTAQLSKDPYGSVIMTYTHNASANMTTFTNLYEYTGSTNPPPPAQPYYTSTSPASSDTWQAYPPPFANFSAVLGPTVSNTLRVDTLYNFTFELNGMPSVRNIYNPMLVKNDLVVLQNVNRIIERVIRSSYDNKNAAPYLVTQTEYQPLPRSFTNHSLQRGGNVLGLDRIQDDSVIVMVLFIWDNPMNDAIIQALSDAVLGNVTQYTQSVPGAGRPFQYLNYAQVHQDPIGSYGNDSVEFLKRVSAEVDPGQVFQTLVPGGWKLGDAGRRYGQFNFNDFDKFAA